MEQINAFLEKAKTDAGLMEKLSGLEVSTGADGIISLAGEYGFTLTKEEVENAMGAAAPGNELSEEQLAVVTGGASQNRYNPAVCKKGGRTMYNCVGFLQTFYCDHYRKTFIEDWRPKGYGRISMFLHECVMGCYKYIGNTSGDIEPEYSHEDFAL